jgi:uncharacterized membrane protein YbhN (UPF0104 family)
VTPTLSRLVKLLRPALGLLIVAALVYAVVTQWAEVRVAIRSIPPTDVVLSTAAVLVGSVAAMFSWRALLADEGHPLGVVDAGRIFLVGQLGKYLPGSVWSVVVQMELATRSGVPRARTFTASLCWIGLTVSSALTVGVIGLPALAAAGSSYTWFLQALLPVALVCSHPGVLTRIVNLLLRAMRRAPLPRELSWRGVGEAFGWLLVTWLCYGVSLWMLYDAIGATGWSGFLRCLGGFALAMGAGLVIVVAPSGAGVREAIIVSALAGVMASGEALGIAVVSRMVFIVTDIALAGGAALSAWRLLRRSRPTVEPDLRP